MRIVGGTFTTTYILKQIRYRKQESQIDKQEKFEILIQLSLNVRPHFLHPKFISKSEVFCIFKIDLKEFNKLEIIMDPPFVE